MDLLSVDFEHPERAASWRIRRGPTGDAEGLERGLRATLDLLGRLGAQATFFVTGDVAREAPHLVREISDRGHEIGCHGMRHIPLALLDRDSFRRDTGEALEALARAGTTVVAGFRAPWWSIPSSDHWALDELESMGFRYDSSIFPIRTTHYGTSGGPRHAQRLPLRRIWEIPPSVADLGPLSMPHPSGFYCRAYPLPLSKWLLERTRRTIHLYFHPWELLPGPPQGSTPLERWIHGVGRHGMAGKLARLLGGRTWRPLIHAMREGVA